VHESQAAGWTGILAEIMILNYFNDNARAVLKMHLPVAM
jgi:hypothetical protein